MAVLRDRAFALANVTFAGATLWTDFLLHDDQRRAMAVAGDLMIDFRKISEGNYLVRVIPFLW